jgi:PIN domain nuclease of toxin-antitoxin system
VSGKIAIKTRTGKLDPGRPLDDIADFLEGIGLDLLPVKHEHVTALVEPQPPTRDPFDRLLLAQCRVEGLQLVTADRALADHPLAWRECR